MPTRTPKLQDEFAFFVPPYVSSLANTRWSDFRTLSFAHAKGLIKGLTRCPTRPRDSSVLSIFGCILEESVRACCGHVASLHLTSGDGCGMVGSVLGTGVLLAPAFPNVDPADSATAAVLPNRAD